MPRPIPELEKANAELKKAQAAASTATMQQWDIYGLSWKARINLMLMGSGLIMLLVFIANIAWSEYQLQQKWHELALRRPQLSTLHGPTPWVGIVASLFFAYRFYMLSLRVRLIYRGTKRFSELRKETLLFLIIGGVIAVLLALAYVLWRNA